MENQENNRARTAAQLGAAAVNIARGAAQGGVAGAAVEGVKSFAPQLITVLAGILFFFFSLPLLIFVGIPSSMFGMPSVESADIRQMTDEAQIAADNYAGTQSDIQQHADYLLQQAAIGYDDVQMSRKLDGFDSYWMAAIASVLHVQELTEINKTEVRNIVSRVVRQTTQAETYMEEEEYVHINEDGTTEIRTREVERKRLIVSQRIATPEEVMTQLGFTDFERQWAYQIHDTIADNQEQDDTPSVDMGDVTFTDTETHVVYYSQVDSRWSDKAYSGSTIGIAGCGPTSVAIAVSTLTGRTITPDQVAEWSEATGHAAYGNGSYHSLIPDALAHYGLTVQRAGTSCAQQLADALSAGKLVVVIMGPGTFTSTGHFMVLRGTTATGKVLIADPISYNRSQKEWDLALILREAKHSAAAGGPFWIVS